MCFVDALEDPLKEFFSTACKEVRKSAGEDPDLVGLATLEGWAD